MLKAVTVGKERTDRFEGPLICEWAGFWQVVGCTEKTETAMGE